MLYLSPTNLISDRWLARFGARVFQAGFVCASLLCVGATANGQGAVSANPDGPFADSLERRRAEQDLRAVPLKLRERRERNFSNPRIVKQMNEDFLRIQAIRAEMAKAFAVGVKHTPDALLESAREVNERATRLRTNLALSDDEQEIDIPAASTPTVESINDRAFELCIEISRFTGNPMFKRKGVVTINQAREATAALDAVIALADTLRKESSRVKKRGR